MAEREHVLLFLPTLMIPTNPLTDKGKVMVNHASTMTPLAGNSGNASIFLVKISAFEEELKTLCAQRCGSHKECFLESGSPTIPNGDQRVV